MQRIILYHNAISSLFRLKAIQIVSCLIRFSSKRTVGINHNGSLLIEFADISKDTIGNTHAVNLTVSDHRRTRQSQITVSANEDIARNSATTNIDGSILTSIQVTTVTVG